MNSYMLKAYLDLHLLMFDIPNLCDSVLRFRRIRKIYKKNAKDSHQDYPAIASRCCMKNFPYQMAGSFKSYYARTKHASIRFYKNGSLIQKMNALGGIGQYDKNGVCKHKIGSCAEQHAAELLLRDNPTCNLNNILFSTPIRPRTNEPRAYCNHCVTIFNL